MTRCQVVIRGQNSIFQGPQRTSYLFFKPDVFLGDTQPRLFTYCLWLCSCYKSRAKEWDDYKGDYIVRKDQGMYCFLASDIVHKKNSTY